MANKYKLLIADVDGTLLDGHGVVSVEDRAALAEALRAGVRVSLCSGRAREACLTIIRQLGLDSYHIFFDGALVATAGLEEEVYACPIDKSVVKRMVEACHTLGIDLELYTATSYFAERETWSTLAHREFFNIHPMMVGFDGVWEKERIVKGLVAVTNRSEQARVDAFQWRMGDSLYFSFARTPAYPGVTFVNIVAPGTNKGKAVEALAAHIDVPLSSVVAIGDGSNDLSLLGAAGLGIAMGNAQKELKAVADYVTLDVQHNGFAAAVRKFLL